MAAPEFVPPAAVRANPKAYSSPPRRLGSWCADRPGDLGGTPQPRGGSLGVQGPDQGYALLLAKSFSDDLSLADGEHAKDALAAGVALAMRRASSFGRAPVRADVEVALTMLGYLGATVEPEMVEWRRHAVAELSSPHHYVERNQLANAVSEPVLRLSCSGAERARVDAWRRVLGA